MAIVRYNGGASGDTIAFDLTAPTEDGGFNGEYAANGVEIDYAVIRNSSAGLTVHVGENHHSAQFNANAAGNTFTVGAAADWNGEIPGAVLLYFVSGGGPANGLAPNEFIIPKANYNHTTGTNSFTLTNGVSYHTSNIIEAIWTTHDSTQSFTLTAANAPGVGINHFDHIQIGANQHVTVEHGISFRPGNK